MNETTKRSPEEMAYDDALTKLKDACYDLDVMSDMLRLERMGQPIPVGTSDMWNEVWRRLCQVSAVVRAAEPAYHRLKAKENVTDGGVPELPEVPKTVD
jgi:hypothetical protein